MVDFVGGEGALGGGGGTGNVFITWNGQDASLLGFNTCPTPPTASGTASTQIANVQYVRAAISEFASGTGGGGTITWPVPGDISRFSPPLSLANGGTGMSVANNATLLTNLGAIGLWVGANAPPNSATHPLWFDDSDGQLFVHDGTNWIIAVNPPAGPGGGTSPGGPSFDTVNPSVTALPGGQGAAAALGSQTSLVTGGTGGVRWDSPQAGDHRFVHNATATAITFYPPSGAQINSLAANAGVFIQPNTTGFVKAISSSRLVTVP